MKHFLSLLLFALSFALLPAQHTLHYEIATEGAIGDGDYTASLLTQNRHGIMTTEANSAYLTAGLEYAYDAAHWQLTAGATALVQTDNYAATRLHELYVMASCKWADLLIGSREMSHPLRNIALSSGSTVWSGNAAPVPQVMLRTHGFLSIPKTNNWLQVYLDGGYGYFSDSNFQEDRYTDYLAYRTSHNLTNDFGRSFVTTDVWYHHKSIFFRTNPQKQWVLTAGLEHAVQFGGNTINYESGSIGGIFKQDVRIKDFFKVLLPTSGDDTSTLGDQYFVYGNHLGNINGMITYQWGEKQEQASLSDLTPNYHQYSLSFYLENLFEDGSGMAKRNGADGLWGIEYKNNRPHWLSGAVIEYIQTTNQGGPIHWAPTDYSPDTQHTIPNEARGADDYYNNYFYTGYTHYGMNCGSPMLMSPIYNRDAYLRLVHTRIRGMHLAFEGQFLPNWQYKVQASWRKGWGTSYIPTDHTEEATCAMLSVTYHTPTGLSTSWLRHWHLTASCGFDRGSMLGDNTSFSLRIARSGNLFSK